MAGGHGRELPSSARGGAWLEPGPECPLVIGLIAACPLEVGVAFLSSRLLRLSGWLMPFGKGHGSILVYVSVMPTILGGG